MVREAKRARKRKNGRIRAVMEDSLANRKKQPQMSKAKLASASLSKLPAIQVPFLVHFSIFFSLLVWKSTKTTGSCWKEVRSQRW